jgi:hypothetical protein
MNLFVLFSVNDIFRTHTTIVCSKCINKKDYHKRSRAASLPFGAMDSSRDMLMDSARVNLDKALSYLSPEAPLLF